MPLRPVRATRTRTAAALALAAVLLSACSLGGGEPPPVRASGISGPGQQTGTILAADSFAPAPADRSWAPAPRDVGGLRALATVDGERFALHTAGGDVEFLPGVNLGATTPGHAPGELSVTAEEYRRWFPLMTRMGLRVLRVYTIHPPAFYAELVAYNEAHPEAPLYLVQGAYFPDETYNEPDSAGLYDEGVTAAFQAELRDASDAVHGRLARTPQRGRASGEWTVDASAWVAAWIIGIELDPVGTLQTDERNPDAPAHEGRYFRSTPEASPSERWLAARMDEIASYEAAHGLTVPVAFANWPTMDPLRHPAEPLQDREDLVGVDANHVLPTDAWPAGTFASYHAYPYYPDFLRHEEALSETLVDGEPDAYAGYLSALREHHAGMPTMVTEFGVPSSLGSAHHGTRGRDQGGHSEQDAMAVNADLLRIIRDQGLAGGFVFQWTDEWFKFTWNTLPRHEPADRRPLWHDPLTNEQWFGLLASDPRGSEDGVARVLHEAPEGPVRRVLAAHDESWVHLQVELAEEPSGPVRLGFDVVDGGPPVLPGGGAADGASDYAVVVDGDRAQAHGRADLDMTELDFAWEPGVRPEPVDGWRPQQMTVNRALTVPTTGERLGAEFLDVGVLHHGTWDPSSPDYDSLATWRRDGAVLHLRLPWSLLGMTDPSSRQALAGRDGELARTVTTERIGVVVDVDGARTAAGAVAWEPWQRTYSQGRVKAGVQAFVDAVVETSP